LQQGIVMTNKTMLGKWLTTALISATLISCSSPPKKQLATSSLNPSGKGTVTVRSDANRNTALEIEVDHLARPERIAQDAKTYVVWISPVNNPSQAQSLGALTVDQNLNGSLAAVTPLQSFDLFITPEPSATVTKPSGERMLWTQVNNQQTS
jgi:hypothetical protein